MIESKKSNRNWLDFFNVEKIKKPRSKSNSWGLCLFGMALDTGCLGYSYLCTTQYTYNKMALKVKRIL